jgi:hypothetical protein
VKPGEFRSIRIPYRKSCQKVCIESGLSILRAIAEKVTDKMLRTRLLAANERG